MPEGNLIGNTNSCIYLMDESLEPISQNGTPRGFGGIFSSNIVKKITNDIKKGDIVKIRESKIPEYSSKILNTDEFKVKNMRKTFVSSRMVAELSQLRTNKDINAYLDDLVFVRKKAPFDPKEMIL